MKKSGPTISTRPSPETALPPRAQVSPPPLPRLWSARLFTTAPLCWVRHGTTGQSLSAFCRCSQAPPIQGLGKGIPVPVSETPAGCSNTKMWQRVFFWLARPHPVSALPHASSHPSATQDYNLRSPLGRVNVRQFLTRSSCANFIRNMGIALSCPRPKVESCSRVASEQCSLYRQSARGVIVVIWAKT